MTDSLNILEDNDIQTINLDLDLTTTINNDSLGIELLADPKSPWRIINGGPLDFFP